MDNYLTPSHNAIVYGATIEGAMDNAKVGESYEIMTDPLFEVRFGISDTNVAGDNRFSVSISLVKK
ncbi:hypothetical protein H4S03_001492 [Coemansia sp. S3946]|nr:hypothetical protein H4S03_001492 [Coemansia sp. S3946]